MYYIYYTLLRKASVGMYMCHACVGYPYYFCLFTFLHCHLYFTFQFMQFIFYTCVCTPIQYVMWCTNVYTHVRLHVHVLIGSHFRDINTFSLSLSPSLPPFLLYLVFLSNSQTCFKMTSTLPHFLVTQLRLQKSGSVVKTKILFLFHSPQMV